MTERTESGGATQAGQGPRGMGWSRVKIVHVGEGEKNGRAAQRGTARREKGAAPKKQQKKSGEGKGGGGKGGGGGQAWRGRAPTGS